MINFKTPVKRPAQYNYVLIQNGKSVLFLLTCAMQRVNSNPFFNYKKNHNYEIRRK